MTINFFGSLGSYVPAATGQVIEFSRNPKSFSLNKYAQLYPTKDKKQLGFYYRLGVDYSVRVENDEEWIWKAGARRPHDDYTGPKFDTVPFQTIRRDRQTTIDWKTIEVADVKVLVVNTRGIQSQLMTARTNRLWNGSIFGGPTATPLTGGLENPSNWGTNTNTANGLNGNAGYWDQGSSEPGSSNFCAIKGSLDTALSQINLLTNGAVDNVEDAKLMLVLNPDAALRISRSPEIHGYLKESPYAMDQVRGKVAGQNSKWGLPDQLYGWDIVVEPAMIVTQGQNSADAIGSEASIAGGSLAPRRYIKAYNTACILSRVGALDGDNGAPSYSTAQIYYCDKEMELKTFDEPKDELTELHCTEDIVPGLAAPASGFLITNLFSV